MKFLRAYHFLIIVSVILFSIVCIYFYYSNKLNKSYYMKETLKHIIHEEEGNIHKLKMKNFNINEKISKEKKNYDVFDPKKEVNLDLNFLLKSDVEAEKFYYKTITKNTINCTMHERIGRQDDGGWDVCLSGNFKLKNSNCLSYSFGVNYIWEFDDIISSKFGCIVRTFDPSMNLEKNEIQRPSKVWFYKIGLGKEDTRWKNGWQIMKMSSILKKFNEFDKVIDILKIDIEFSEWDSFESMLKEGLLSKVKQIMFETHTDEVQSGTSNKESFIRFLRVWNGIYEVGFRQWKNSWNHFGQYTSKHSGKLRTCCYEHYLINTNYI